MKLSVGHLAGLLMCAACPLFSFAQLQVDPVYVRLAYELQQLASRSYRPETDPLVLSVDRGGQQRFSHQLAAQATYAIIGVCDENCTHVRMSLYDPQGTLLLASPDESSVVIIGGAAVSSGSYVLELAVPGCQKEACQAGFLLARLEPKEAEVDPQPPRPRPVDTPKRKGGGTTVGGKSYRDF